MNKDKIVQRVKKNMSKSRFEHTLRVVKEAVKLAKRYEEDEKKAEIAAFLHDYAKELPIDRMQDLIKGKLQLEDLLQYHPAIWHGPVGAYLIEKELGIKDKDIIQAVKCHTTGSANMSSLSMIIFIADYIEPARNFPAVHDIRAYALENLQKAVLSILINNMRYIVSRNEKIYPATVYAYNDLISKGITCS